jgi:hypothetical protein
MIRKYCDRCGIECEILTTIKIPKEKIKLGYITKEIEVCQKCNDLHESLLETLTDIRFTLYGNIFMKGFVERSENGT